MQGNRCVELANAKLCHRLLPQGLSGRAKTPIKNRVGMSSHVTGNVNHRRRGPDSRSAVSKIGHGHFVLRLAVETVKANTPCCNLASGNSILREILRKSGRRGPANRPGVPGDISQVGLGCLHDFDRFVILIGKGFDWLCDAPNFVAIDCCQRCSSNLP